MNPQDTTAKKPEAKKPQASTKGEEWVEVPARKNLTKKKPQPEAKIPDWPWRAHLEAVLIKPAEGVSYTGILKDLKKHVKLDMEPSIEAEDIEDAVRGFFDHGSELELTVSLTKRPYRGNRKAYVLLEEVRALKLLKATHIKIKVAAKRGTLRGPAQGNRNAIFAPLKIRLFGGKPQEGSLREATYETMKAVDGDAKGRRRAPIEHDPEV